MIERRFTVDGTLWTVTIPGRFTVYERDEFPLLFERRNEHGVVERRVTRFSPLGSRSRSPALAELSDAELEYLFRQTQPDWTSPELGYGRS